MSAAGRLHGKLALVTAAAQGIGRATALAFAREGAAVLATDVNLEKVRELNGTPGIETRRLDVLDDDAIRGLAREVTPTVLVNCAGVVHGGTVLDCTPDEWDVALRLNVRSQYQTIRAFLPGMLKQGGGAIVNISSVAGSIRGVPNPLSALARWKILDNLRRSLVPPAL